MLDALILIAIFGGTAYALVGLVRSGWPFRPSKGGGVEGRGNYNAGSGE